MTLLDIAGYSLFGNADAFLATTGKVLLTGAGMVLGGFLLLVMLLVTIAIIAVISVRRGIRYQSVPRTVGTFFRWAGMAVGLFLSALIIPVIAYWFSVPALYLLIAFAVSIGLGYFIGRTISKLIGMRISKYAMYIRTVDTIGSRVRRFINGM